ncbi:hypothetical protein B0T36_22980 [Nocardia donostiensis]|nr:hypothetical protein B0T36_22980 [Nocardia donostiensis]
MRSREERSSFLILCEGKTEKRYFTGMRSRYGPQLDVDYSDDWDHCQVAREAVDRWAEAQRSGTPYEGVWCVLDTELDQALVRAISAELQDTKVQVAFSCPSFEVWLILHIRDYRKPFQSAQEAKALLRDVVPGWTPNRTEFSRFKAGLADAVERAQTLEPTGNSHLANPSSGVWQLIAAIQAATV